jgi:hypothetical protein
MIIDTSILGTQRNDLQNIVCSYTTKGYTSHPILSTDDQSMLDLIKNNCRCADSPAELITRISSRKQAVWQ